MAHVIQVPARRLRAFTLIELLVVIAILAVLIGLLVPAVQKVREAAARIKCQNNLKQLAIACITFEVDHGAFPRGNALNSSSFSTGDNGASWLFMVLPYMEQDPLYKRVRAAGTIQAAFNQGILPVVLPLTRCPTDGWDLSNGNLCNYVGSSGPQCNIPPTTGGCDTPIFQRYCNGANQTGYTPPVPATLSPPTYPGYDASYTWGDTSNPNLVRGMFVRGGAKIRVADVTDGTSNTILLGEMLPEFSEFQRYTFLGWVGGNDVSQGQTIQFINWPIDPIPLNGPAQYSADCQQTGTGACPSGPEHCMWNWHVTWGFKSRHPGGVNFAFVDGSVHYVSETIDHQVYQYLGCRHDNQPVALPF
jgi:prepilin-type N-terminal cleavage/methylation domain-containing protein/prepilin-type processing-associated H-X9-DG protein